MQERKKKTEVSRQTNFRLQTRALIAHFPVDGIRVPRHPHDSTMTNPVAGAFLKQIDLVEHDLVGLAKAVPDERYDFRPSGASFDSARTFGEQVRHAATMIFMTAAIVLEEQSPHGPGANDNGPADIQGKEQIVGYLEASIRYARKAMASLTPANCLDPLKTYFGQQPRIEVAAGVAYHSYNHYGQMVIYARLVGVVPPSPPQMAGVSPGRSGEP